MALERSDPYGPGITRRRRGRGFSYLSPDGEPIGDAETLQRLRSLVIPPAWRDVWICASERGHIQAVGIDAAGRRQYIYHPLWREQRDQEKFDRVVEFAEQLPRVRKIVAEHLIGEGLTRQRVLAAAVRLLDLGFFRIGGEEYADDNGSFGLATIRREHVTCSRDEVIFEYPAKWGKMREQSVVEEDVCRVVSALRRRRSGGDELLAYREGRQWRDVRSQDINAYLRELFDGEVTAKDFRTWSATVLAAVGLAVSAPAARTSAARKRAISRVVAEVAEYLGNTPAVARGSYIDPRVIEAYERGKTISSALHKLGAEGEYGQPATQGAVEEAVIKLLRDS